MGAIGGIFSSSHSSTRGAPICSLGATSGGRSLVPDCCAIAASDNASLLASKAPTSNERADRAGPAARPSHGNRQTPIASVTIANAQLMDRCLTCTFLTRPSLITGPPILPNEGGYPGTVHPHRCWKLRGRLPIRSIDSAEGYHRRATETANWQPLVGSPRSKPHSVGATATIR